MPGVRWAPLRGGEKDRVLIWRRLTVQKGGVGLVPGGCGFKMMIVWNEDGENKVDRG